MVTIPVLSLCILLAAAIVWIASAIIWMVLPHHKSDYKGLPDEEAARAALNPQALQPGQYNIPHLPSWDAMKEPEHRRKFDEGPVGFLTVLPNRPPPMGKAIFSVVHLFRRRQHRRRLCHRQNLDGRGRVHGRLPRRRHDGVPGIRNRQHNQFNLVWQALVRRDQGHLRLIGVRPVDGWSLCRILA